MKKNIIFICFVFLINGCATVNLTYLKPVEMSPYGKYPVKINHIIRRSEAEKAGLIKGDIIQEVDGKLIKTNGDAWYALKEINNEGILKIVRDGKNLSIKLKKDNNEQNPSGIFLWQEEWTLPFKEPKGVYQYLISKDGIIVDTVAVIEKNSPFAVFNLTVKNKTEDTIDIFPENILVLDGQNSILKIFGGKILAANMAGSAERNYNAYSNFASTQLTDVQSQPPSSYTVTGFTQHTGSGTLYSYGSYGNFNYSGRSFSNYQITPQPNYGAAVASLGYAVGMMIARNRAENQRRVAEGLYMNTFEFGQIPPETNRTGLLFCQKPLHYPLQIKAGIKGNVFLFKLEEPNKAK